MSEVVERVARAICAVEGVDPDELWNPKSPRLGWKLWTNAAKSAIAAMREPTVEMEIAGTESWALHEVAMEDRARTNWNAMIDEALK